MMEAATIAAAMTVALGAVELAKVALQKLGNGPRVKTTERLCVLGRDSPGLAALDQMAKVLTDVQSKVTASAGQTAALWEAHRPVDGRYRWWFPESAEAQQKEVLDELRKIAATLARIEANGKGGP